VDQYIERMEREEAERAEQQRRQGAETIYGADAPAVLSTCTFSSSGVGHQASGISDKRRQAHVQEMQTLLEDMQAGALSETQCKLMAVREKNKGNECFRCGEHEVAFLHYSRSIALDPTQPAAYTNRAIAAIHLKRYETAEDDCSRALAVDAGFLKAYLRRGMARMHRGHFGEVRSMC
jgi:tetratricopeptide (TPR) repeat protein